MSTLPTPVPLTPAPPSSEHSLLGLSDAVRIALEIYRCGPVQTPEGLAVYAAACNLLRAKMTP